MPSSSQLVPVGVPVRLQTGTLQKQASSRVLLFLPVAEDVAPLPRVMLWHQAYL